MSQHKRSEHRLGNELKQSAEKIKNSAENQLHKIQGEGHTKRSPREVQTRRRKAWFIVGTIFAVLLLTIIFFSILFSMYINRTMKNKVEVDLAAYDLSLATEMYAKDSDTGEYKLYQTLYDGENRILLTSDQIPQSLRDAAVAIEDKRFYKHKGVDWNKLRKISPHTSCRSLR